MNTVERIKALCKEKRIAVSRLEKECGFANGYIGQLKKGVLPDDRLRIVAEYLHVSPLFLSTGEDYEKESIEGMKYYFSDETAELAQAMYKDDNLRLLADGLRKVSKDDLAAVIAMVEVMKRKENNK